MEKIKLKVVPANRACIDDPDLIETDPQLPQDFEDGSLFPPLEPIGSLGNTQVTSNSELPNLAPEDPSLPTSIVTKKPRSRKNPAQLGQIMIDMSRL